MSRLNCCAHSLKMYKAFAGLHTSSRGTSAQFRDNLSCFVLFYTEGSNHAEGIAESWGWTWKWSWLGELGRNGSKRKEILMWLGYHPTPTALSFQTYVCTQTAMQSRLGTRVSASVARRKLIYLHWLYYLPYLSEEVWSPLALLCMNHEVPCTRIHQPRHWQNYYCL